MKRALHFEKRPGKGEEGADKKPCTGPSHSVASTIQRSLNYMTKVQLHYVLCAHFLLISGQNCLAPVRDEDLQKLVDHVVQLSGLREVLLAPLTYFEDAIA